MANGLKISLLGCGWLGVALANLLISKGYIVKGSTTTPSKLERLKGENIVPFLVHFREKSPPEKLSEFLLSKVLVICIPPGRNNPEKNEDYRRMAAQISDSLLRSTIKQLIFISSTSVYGDCNQEVDESTVAVPDDASGKLLLEVEQQFVALQNITDIKVSVLRLSGLIGPNRHPARFFAGKTDIPNGLAPVNLIHLDDVCGIILKLIEKGDINGIFTASAPSHPTKQEFYTQAAKQQQLPLPTFKNQLNNWKIIRSDKIASILEYDFQINDLSEWLSSN
jgi:nucleoside-diphosphate-sugar epimerase